MAFSLYRETRVFTAGEAEVLSRVSPALQRDWRRRRLLEESSGRAWVRYTLSEVCILAMMKAFSEAGFSVKSSLTLAKSTAFLAETFLEMLPGAVAFEGEDLTDSEKQEFLAVQWEDRSSSRYVFSPLPDRDPTNELASAYTFKSLSEIEDKFGEGWFYGLIFDLKAMAQDLHSRAPLPLVTYRVVKEANE